MEPFQRPVACRADGRRRPYRPFRHRLGNQARPRRRDRTRPTVRRAGHAAEHIPERSPPTRRFAASTSRASRTRRATRWNGSKSSAGATPTRSSRAVLLFDADALAAHQPREFAAARQAGWKATSAGSRAETGVPVIGRRTRASADAHALSRARPHARQSHRRVADGDVFGERRADRRFPSRASGRARDGRRGPRLRRDDLRLAGSAHHAGLSWPLERRAGARNGSGSSISSTTSVMPRLACSSAMPAARARRGSRGKASTSRWIMTTGR